MFPVYVDNIQENVKTKDLRNLFSRHGKVTEVTIVSHYGFVIFGNADDAVRCIGRLNNYRLFGQRLVVSASKELEDFLEQRAQSFRQQQQQRRRASHEQYHGHNSHGHHRHHEEHFHHNRSSTRSRSEDEKHHYRQRRYIKIETVSASAEGSNSNSESNDLRHVIESKRPKLENFKVEIPNVKEEETSEGGTTGGEEMVSSPTPEMSPEDPKKTLIKPKVEKVERLPSGVVELFVGKLSKYVEKFDLEALLDVYGIIKSVEMKGDHALVQIECSPEVAQEAIEVLNHSQWMDSSIEVRFSQEPTKVQAAKNIQKDVEMNDQSNAVNDEFYEIWVWSSCLKKDTFLDDICDLISDYGEVENKRWRLEDSISESIALKISANQNQIIECLNFLNTFYYKNHGLRAKFPDGSQSEKDLASKVSNYHFKLHPESFLPSTSSGKKTNDKKVKKREIWLWTPSIQTKKTFLKDMAVLVSQYGKVISQGWKNEHIYIELESSEKQAARCINETHGFPYKAAKIRAKFADETPEDNLYKDPAYAVILRNYEKNLIPITVKLAKSKSRSPPPSAKIPEEPEVSPILTMDPKPRVVNDAIVIESVEGTIFSVNPKLILVKFSVGSRGAERLARIKPGHMYIDAKRNLGYTTKNLRYPEWSDSIKDIFMVGKRVLMDVRKLSQIEEEEMHELTSEIVMYEASLLWKAAKPSADCMIQKDNQGGIHKATVIKLWPKWAILQPLSFNEGQNLILMLLQEFYCRETSEPTSLLNHIEVGDTLAVKIRSKEYLDMVEKAQGLDFFTERTNNLKYETLLAWQINTEIDPHEILKKKQDNEKANDDHDSDSKIEFLASSNNLNLSLPSEKEATHKRRKGIIEELHLPSGGIIRLTDNMGPQQWGHDVQRVYFHRSRCYVNSVRMVSHAILQDEISVGDAVTVDLMANQADLTTTYMSGTEAYWIALSVKISTSDRGVSIANKLRAEVSKSIPSSGSTILKSFEVEINGFLCFFSECGSQCFCKQCLPRKSGLLETSWSWRKQCQCWHCRY